MPVIFAIDSSLSMFMPLTSKDANETVINTCKLAVLSAVEFLSTTYQRSIQLALASFSSQFKLIMPFTRDSSSCKSALDGITCGDVVDVNSFVAGINRVVLEAWNSSQTITVVVVTDGGISLKLNGVTSPSEQPSFAFPVKFHLVVVNPSGISGLTSDTSQWDKLVSQHDGSVHLLNASSAATAVTEFGRFAVAHLQLPAVHLQLGCLSTFASVYPPAAIFSMPERVTFDIGGFLPANVDVYNAEAASRHLLLFRENDNVPISIREENQTSSFLTILFTVLKQENVVAVCRMRFASNNLPEGAPLRELVNQYAIIHVSSEQKKRPCLNVAVMKQGSNPIPWLGPISSLTLAALTPTTPNVVPQRKKSYNDPSSYIAWGKAEGLKSDVHRILRLAKKLPDKSSPFLKELNKLRVNSLTLGTVDLLNVVSSALGREASSCSSPEGKAMLNYCAEQLSSGPPSQEIDQDVVYNPKQPAA